MVALIVAATRRDRRPYPGRKRIALRVGNVVNKYKMAKHYELDITEEPFTYERNAESIAAGAALDGLYVIRTSLPAEEMGAEATVQAYRGLSVVEQAFRDDLYGIPVVVLHRRTLEAGELKLRMPNVRHVRLRFDLLVVEEEPAP